MKEVITKFLLITVAIFSIASFVYGTLWTDVKSVTSDTQAQIEKAQSSDLN